MPDDFQFTVTNQSPEYLAKFPAGKIPTLEIPGSDFRLFESNAIVYYLAENAVTPEKRKQLIGETVHERATIQQWSEVNGQQSNQQWSLAAA